MSRLHQNSCHFFTVCTPTFNRGHTLPRVFSSLCAQTFQDFEWIVVDDGSTDNTAQLVEQWAHNASFPVRYLRQANMGKHIALNRAVHDARGELFTTVDSDDWLPSHALECLAHHWDILGPDLQSSYAGIVGLCADPNGHVIGSRFPDDVFDSDLLEIRIRYRIRGDKTGAERTDVLRAFPFPSFPGERFLPEAVVHNRIAEHYRSRFVNEVLLIKEYRSEGLTADSATARARSPRGARLHYLEVANAGRPLPLPIALRTYANYVRFSLHAHVPPRQLFSDVRQRSLVIAAAAVGLVLWARDRVQIRSATQSTT